PARRLPPQRGAGDQRSRVDSPAHARGGQRRPEGRRRAGARAPGRLQEPGERRLPHAVVRPLRELSRGVGGHDMNLLLYFVVMAAAMLGLSRILPGFHVNGWVPALFASVVLAAVNTVLKPILFVLTLPFTILTLGLFLFVLNAICL